METVETILDPLILTGAIIAVVLLVAALFGIRNMIAGQKQILEQQKNQNNLLMNISNVLTSTHGTPGLQSRTSETSEAPKKQDV